MRRLEQYVESIDKFIAAVEEEIAAGASECDPVDVLRFAKLLPEALLKVSEEGYEAGYREGKNAHASTQH